jgi:hypothetical protein
MVQRLNYRHAATIIYECLYQGLLYKYQICDKMIGVRFLWRLEMRRVLVLLVVFGAISTAHSLQDGSDSVENVTLASLIRSVYEAKIVPGGYLKVQMPDGSTKQVKTPGFMKYQVPTGWLIATGLELVEDFHSVAADVKAFKPRTSGSAPTYIVVCYTDNSGTVTSYKSGILDRDSPVTALDDFYFPEAPTDGSWPILYAMAWSSYQDAGQNPQWTGALRWSSKLDTSTMTVIERVPNAISKSTKDGATGFSLLAAKRLSATQISMQDSSMAQYTYPCNSPCVVDGRTMLALWKPVSQ